MDGRAILECVPNFSEGRDVATIQAIADAIAAVEGVQLLNVDPGRDTNRTVVTFVGAPEAVVEAAFQGAKTATERIDMRRHNGAHPRFGAVDVLPLVPVSGITMEEVVALAHRLGKRLGEELGISVYCYEHAATSEERRNLANVRAGEYEGLAKKLAEPDWAPDFGPRELNERSGATALGARDFLIAYNVNLNTTSTRRANAVAFDVREKGRVRREGGQPVVDAQGALVYDPGTLKGVKAIGWYIPEYGQAQVSINLTDIATTPLHVVFDECCRSAESRGLRVTGSELIGLTPLRVLLDAGRHFLRKQRRSTGVSDRELIQIAVKSLGLDDLRPFDPEEKVIEYAMAKGRRPGLVDLSVKRFVEEVASESPAPGGGSVAAAVGALGAALGTMVANLSAHKPGWDERWEEFSDYAERGKACHDRLLDLVDEDTRAFDALMACYKAPKSTDEEKAARKEAIRAATRRAIEVPLRTMEVALEAAPVVRAMAERGNPNSISDAAVGALCLRAAALGAYLNVRTNASSLKGDAFATQALAKAEELLSKAEDFEREVIGLVKRAL